MITAPDIEALRARFADVERAVRAACTAAGRRREDVTVVAVSKLQPIPAMIVYQQWAAEQQLPCVFGENYVQELSGKRAAIGPAARINLIGRLQSNKVESALRDSSMVQSVDRIKILELIHRAGTKRGTPFPVFVQVNISEDPEKGGFSVAEIEGLFHRAAREYSGIDIRGVLTITRDYGAPEEAAPDYLALASLARRLDVIRGAAQPVQISMGMSQDFAVAIRCGATEVRIGSALFGERPAA